MKKIIFVLLMLIFFCQGVSAENEKIYRAADEVDMGAVSELLGNFSFEELAQSLAKGEGIPVRSYGEKITDYLFGEVKEALSTLALAVAVSLLCGIISGLCFNDGASNITFFMCYTIVVGVAAAGFSAVAEMGVDAIKNMTVFMSAAVPCFGALRLASGNIASSMATAAPVLMMSAVSGYIINYIGMPAVYMSLAIGLVGNLNQKYGLDKLAKLIRKTALWIVCGVETLLCAVIGITDFSTGTIDKVAGKAAKFAVSSTIPVVGGILSDATEALTGSAAIIKNTAGTAGMILIFMLIAAPVLKTVATLFAYRLCAAITQPVTDKRISSSLSDMAEVLSTLTGMLIAIGTASIISLGILLGGLK